MEMGKVMVAIDESECSHYALQWVLQKLTDTVSKSQLIILTAQPADFSYVYPSTFGVAPPELITSLRENQNKAAVVLLGTAKEICAKHGIVAETITVPGDPKEVICEAVEKHNIQLLVVGSHNRGTLQRTLFIDCLQSHARETHAFPLRHQQVLARAFLGSVSNYCIHNAKCPVLVVRKPV